MGHSCRIFLHLSETAFRPPLPAALARISLVLQRLEPPPERIKEKCMGLPAPFPGQVNDLHLAEIAQRNFPYAWRPPTLRWNGNVFPSLSRQVMLCAMSGMSESSEASEASEASGSVRALPASRVITLLQSAWGNCFSPTPPLLPAALPRTSLILRRMEPPPEIWKKSTWGYPPHPPGRSRTCTPRKLLNAISRMRGDHQRYGGTVMFSPDLSRQVMLCAMSEASEASEASGSVRAPPASRAVTCNVRCPSLFTAPAALFFCPPYP